MLTLTTILALAATAIAVPYTPTNIRSTPNKTYTLTTTYSGPTFFENFSFFTGADPTNGFVNYTSRTLAATSHLVGFIHNETSNTSTAYIGVDHSTTTTTGRNSVRLIGNEKFNAGSMAVIDVRHIPVVNGVWPAIWFLGGDGTWPDSGESDILEYVHTGESGNSMTLHTAPGFSVGNDSSAYEGRLLNSDCNAGDAGTGCSISMVGVEESDAELATAGEAFNTQGGGVYVHDWTTEGITVWLFPRDELPADLVAGHPDSSTWTRKPLAKFTGKGDFGTTFKDMQLIINIDFCGDWAGNAGVWASSGAQKTTGASTCVEYVGANPQVYKNAYFEIGSIEFYTKGGGAANATSYEAPSKRGANARNGYHYGHGHNHSLGHSLAAPTDSAKLGQPSSSMIEKRSGEISAASATEVAGWLVGAGMFFAVAFSV